MVSIIKIPVPGEKLLMRMWQTVAEGGIGTVFRPWQIRRDGRALTDVRCEEVLKLAQAERDADDIRAGRARLLPGTTTITRTAEPDVEILESASAYTAVLEDRLRERVLADTLRQEVNITRALAAAEAALENDPSEPPDAYPHNDWLYRWRDYAAGVSTDDLQQLWGQVLAGEVKSPGSFSLRTLDFLRNLSSDEAKEIARLSPFVVYDFIHNNRVVTAKGIKLAYLLRMQDLGVLAGVEGAGLRLTLESGTSDSFKRAFRCHERLLLVTHTDGQRKCLLSPVIMVTRLGRELLSLGSFAADVDYLRAIGQSLCEQGFVVHLAKWRDTGAEQFEVFDEEPVCASPHAESGG